MPTTSASIVVVAISGNVEIAYRVSPGGTWDVVVEVVGIACTGQVSPVSTWDVVVVVEDKANQRLDEFARGARVSAPLPIWSHSRNAAHSFAMKSVMLKTGL